ncbi:MAG: hypothetical protein M0R80_17650 [Proteobacteria bacterium]|jgi:hypothetical protein|nr:hypothetical protein [Pseudomonadota bacterium]
MLVSELFLHINDAYRATDDDAPTAGTADYSYWLRVANRKINEWARDTKVTWESLSRGYFTEPGTVSTVGTTALTGVGTYFLDYEVGDKINVEGETERTIDTITSNTALTVTVAFTNTTTTTFTRDIILKTGVDIYNLNRQFIAPSTNAIVSDATGNYSILNIIKPQEATIDSDAVFIYGMNPQSISFVSTMPTSLVGSQLLVPGYFVPFSLDDASDVVPVDDPMWLVYAVAKDLAANDLTYASKAPDLNAQANNLYTAMVSTNRRGVGRSPRIVPTIVTRIGMR